MFTVVIAGTPSPRRINLEESFSALGSVKVATVGERDGKNLPLLLQRYQPDLLLLELNYSAAAEVLALFRNNPELRPPYVVTYSEVAGLERKASEQMGQALQGQLPLPRPAPHRNAELELERRIGDVLFSLGMPANQKGYRYLVWALKRVKNHPEELTLLTKSLYVEIAHHFSSSQGAVERAMRNAIGNAYRQGNRALWRKYFPRRDQTKAPSNGEFLAGLYELLRLELVENDR